MRRYFSMAATTVGLLAWVGCNEQPAANSSSGSSAAKPAAATKPEQLSEQDKAALRSLAGGPANPGAANTGASGELPPGHPPTGAPTPAAPAAPADGALPAGHPTVGGAPTDLKFDAPADWKPTPLKSAMRKAQYLLPHSGDDTADGELVVNYFGPGEGGPVMDNLVRWKGQFTTADGKPLPADAAKDSKLIANGMPVTLLEVSGRYAPGAMPGMGETAPQDNYRMFAAIIETPNGPWFIKAVGPNATMTAQHDALLKFTQSAHK